MADVKDSLEFFQRGVGMLFNVGLQFLGIERAPFAPARFGGERAKFGGGQIPVNRAPPQVKAACRLDLGTAGLNKFYDPFP